MYFSVIRAMRGVGSMISSAATPATGLPRKPRGVSPQASVVCRPTASSRRQISGTSSIPTQWYCRFCRSVMSAVSRAKSVEMPREDPQPFRRQRLPVDCGRAS